MNDRDGAQDAHSRALEFARQAGNRRVQALVLGNMGALAFERNDLDMSETLHLEALAIDRSVGSRLAEGQDLGNLASTYRDKGDPERAEQYYREALAIFRELRTEPEIRQTEELLSRLAQRTPSVES